MTNCWPSSRASDYADSERAPNPSSRCIGRRFGIIRESARYPLCRRRHKGYTFGRCYSPKTGRAYLGTVPSKKRVIRICEAISEMTGRDQTLLDQGTVVAKLNRTMIGWANYFCLGPVSKAYRAVDQHARKRLRQWLCAKHKVAWPGTKRFPQASLHEVLGLVCLHQRTSNLPWATS
jgi:RNA-directed DNA polymerase